MRPRAEIWINGSPVSSLFYSKLNSVTFTDREGTRSDSLQMTLEAGPPGIQIPDTKAIIQLWMGYGLSLSYMGAFTADDVELKRWPDLLEISGKSADMLAATKQHDDKHWDKKTAGDIFADLAKMMGVTPQIASSIGEIKLEWFGLIGESPMHAANRLGQRVNGLVAVKDGKLIVAEKGSGQRPGGGAVSTLTIVPTMIQPGSLSVKFTGREKHKKVRATFHDKGKAERKFVEADGDPDGESEYTLRHNHANEAEAKKAAESKAKDLQREATTTSVTIEGNTSARGGVPMQYKGVHPKVDGVAFVIESAAHTLGKAGYTTAIQAKKKV